jgi:hypothetical protein
MMYEIWEEMRGLDRRLADEVVEPVFVFMRAQTAKERLFIDNLHDYIVYRQADVGQAYDDPMPPLLFHCSQAQTPGGAHAILVQPQPLSSRDRLSG